jgi:uncharacterized tellurite resistance protein B-like protein
MLKALREFLQSSFGQTAAESVDEADDHSLRLAIAALLVEMSRADFVQNDPERDKLRHLLSRHFALEQAEAEALLGEAGNRAAEMVSLHEFTRAIHDSLSESQKHRFLEMLLEVALADGRFDKHERHLLDKVADLIYVRRADYVSIRDRMLQEADPD